MKKPRANRFIKDPVKLTGADLAAAAVFAVFLFALMIIPL